ncbi:MAG: twin-arginine translocase TatA/TatE family subunit [Planctomycetes bacterium]|nr:twin-arginine translocase TatA/TatE family subunit [Planctomycetota bacterium]
MNELPSLVLGIGMPQGFEWIVILVALLLLFGRRLPEIMRSLGGSLKEFKRGHEDGPAKPVDPPRVEGAVSRDQSPKPPVTPPSSGDHNHN